ncbi:TetR/AcrR family transcriptional regulator [Streptomyces sp. NBC_00859]|uniref:TetR/AcrR family transcriptional regulator n=1 Tax=Streptomyces sp. NBC_00859 TaxID=2903682 RepID=UPI00386A5440|nr:TetR/AcrR family transcriptional regulator [Streptomyces sp. NBC_00859]
MHGRSSGRDPAQGGAKPGVRRAKAALSATAIKEAAQRLFAERGYLNTKITDILSEADRSAGVFYDHFSSKEALLEAMIADFQADASARAVEMPCMAEPGAEHDLSERSHLRDHIAVFWHTYSAHLPVMVAMFQASMVDDGFAHRFGNLLNTSMLRQHLEYMQRRGATLPGNPALVASALSSMLLQFAYVWLAADGRAPGGTAEATRPTDDEAIDTLTSLILYGIVAPMPGSGPLLDQPGG